MSKQAAISLFKQLDKTYGDNIFYEKDILYLVDTFIILSKVGMCELERCFWMGQNMSHKFIADCIATTDDQSELARKNRRIVASILEGLVDTRWHTQVFSNEAKKYSNLAEVHLDDIINMLQSA